MERENVFEIRTKVNSKDNKTIRNNLIQYFNGDEEKLVDVKMAFEKVSNTNIYTSIVSILIPEVVNLLTKTAENRSIYNIVEVIATSVAVIVFIFVARRFLKLNRIKSVLDTISSADLTDSQDK